MCSIYVACGLGRKNMLSDIVAAYVTIALSVCIKTKKNRRQTHNDTNEDHDTGTKILRDLKAE